MILEVHKLSLSPSSLVLFNLGKLSFSTEGHLAFVPAAHRRSEGRKKNMARLDQTNSPPSPLQLLVEEVVNAGAENGRQVREGTDGDDEWKRFWSVGHVVGWTVSPRLLTCAYGSHTRVWNGTGTIQSSSLSLVSFLPLLSSRLAAAFAHLLNSQQAVVLQHAHSCPWYHSAAPKPTGRELHREFRDHDHGVTTEQIGGWSLFGSNS
ncbi:hypothetical protein LZ32DRAFT_216035 [Colletotrichum eremochloae]|nr:hypothetical protein LZ32DRAFT_216035 [Colletotrichum eremochloae]